MSKFESFQQTQKHLARAHNADIESSVISSTKNGKVFNTAHHVLYDDKGKCIKAIIHTCSTKDANEIRNGIKNSIG